MGSRWVLVIVRWWTAGMMNEYTCTARLLTILTVAGCLRLAMFSQLHTLFRMCLICEQSVLLSKGCFYFGGARNTTHCGCSLRLACAFMLWLCCLQTCCVCERASLREERSSSLHFMWLMCVVLTQIVHPLKRLFQWTCVCVCVCVCARVCVCVFVLTPIFTWQWTMLLRFMAAFAFMYDHVCYL